MKPPNAVSEPPMVKIDGELQPPKPIYDPKKKYRYTWPGQPSRVVNGEEMTALVKGADPAQLDIHEDGDAEPITSPDFESKHGHR